MGFRIIHGGMGRNIQTIPSHGFHFQLVPFIWHIFTLVDSQSLKKRLNKKLRNIQKFSHSHSFLWNTEQKERCGAFILCLNS